MSRRFLTLLFTVLLAGCVPTPEPPLIERVCERGVLRVGTFYSASTYRLDASGPTGPEYALVRAFADELGVTVAVVVENRPDRLLSMLQRGEVDVAVGLEVTPRRRRQVMFGPVYQSLEQYVLVRRGVKKPRKLEDLYGSEIEVVRGSVQEEQLRRLAHNGHPRLLWRADAEHTTEELMGLMNDQLVDVTIANHNDVVLYQRFLPDVSVAMTFGEPLRRAWAFRRTDDRSVVRRAERFFRHYTESEQLDRQLAHFYGHLEKAGAVPAAIHSLLPNVYRRLPALQPYFEEAAAETGLDWRFLAAIGYQESVWNPKAVSPTGVRGVMQLTLRAAKDMGIEDRNDPRQSILGGARYFLTIKRRLPKRIQDPDRTWLALAAYNVGFGHLEDARRLTQAGGRNPDRWYDVRQFLPRLAEKQWYTKTRYGYARGGEPVIYVRRVRRYYDLLVWHTRVDVPPEPPPRVPIIDLLTL